MSRETPVHDRGEKGCCESWQAYQRPGRMLVVRYFVMSFEAQGIGKGTPLLFANAADVRYACSP